MRRRWYSKSTRRQLRSLVIALLISGICETDHSVYEVYVKEESLSLDTKSDAPNVSGLDSAADQQLVQVTKPYVSSQTCENDLLW